MLLSYTIKHTPRGKKHAFLLSPFYACSVSVLQRECIHWAHHTLVYFHLYDCFYRRDGVNFGAFFFNIRQQLPFCCSTTTVVLPSGCISCMLVAASPHVCIPHVPPAAIVPLVSCPPRISDPVLLTNCNIGVHSPSSVLILLALFHTNSIPLGHP